MLKKLETWQVVLSIAIALGGIVGGAWALDNHWDQGPELVIEQDARQVNDLASQIMFLEMELRRLCDKYRLNYPCLCSGMSNEDQAYFLRVQNWLEDARRRYGEMMK